MEAALPSAPAERAAGGAKRPRERPDGMDGPSAEGVSSPAAAVPIDGDGRVARGGVDLSALSFGFRSFAGGVLAEDAPLSQLRRECHRVFSAEPAAYGEEELSSGDTHWLAAGAAATTLVEQAVKQIFDFHTRSVREDPRFDDTLSGAEWWTLSIEEDADVGVHFDKDYAMEDEGLNVTPHVSTVTYLSDIGAPTIVTDVRAPRVYGDASRMAQSIGAVHVSLPLFGKHISFDGRMLHAAPSDMYDALSEDARVAAWRQQRQQARAAAAAAAAATTTTTTTTGAEPCPPGNRVSLLVNVWVNHRPAMAAPLPHGLRSACAPASGGAAGGKAPAADDVRVLELRRREGEGCQLLKLPFLQGDDVFALELDVPEMAVRTEEGAEGDGALVVGRSYTLRNADASFFSIRAAEPGEFSDEDDDEEDDDDDEEEEEEEKESAAG